MKVAHLTTVDMSLRYLLLPQLEAAAATGEAIGISAPGPFVTELEARDIRHVPLASSTRGMDPLADLRAALELWRALRRERPDVLHTHNPKPGLYGRVIGRMTGVPIVVNTVHGLYATEDSPAAMRALVYMLEWMAARFSDAELIQSPEDYDLLRRRRIVPRRRLHLLGNGVDLSRFDPKRANESRASVRTELGADEDRIVVGMVGRLVAEKGVPELIEAAERLGSRYLVVVVGPHDPEKGDALPSSTIERGEVAGVRFLGMREDVDRLYGGFDVFVLPSHREGFPRAAMEAAASGLPIVATDIRGCRQVVDDGVNGYLVPVSDPAALAAAIERIASDADRMAAMGRASTEKAGAEFDERRVVEKVMSVYSDLARAKGLGWVDAVSSAPIEIRPALAGDARAVAELHKRMIATGFLSSLGTRFLEVLYRAMSVAPGARLLVAVVDGVVCGFVSGVTDTGDFYRWFLRHHWWRAGLAALPGALRPSALRRIRETLRYGATEESTASAELLSLAVAPGMRGRGVGSHLTEELFDWARSTGLPAMRVVVGADNDVALALYHRMGFSHDRRLEVHAGHQSWEMLWTP